MKLHPFLLVVGLSPATFAQHELFVLDPSPGGSPQAYGASVAIGGGWVVVGDPEEAPTVAGSAHLFSMAVGATYKVVGDQTIYAFFGASTATDGVLAAIGAPGDIFEWGGVYVFDVASGSELMKLQPASGEQDDDFGRSVAIEGGKVICGGNNLDSKKGRIVMFDAATGQELGSLVPNDVSVGDDFGWATAARGNLCVGSSPRDDDMGLDSGSAYVFDLTTAKQVHKLLPSDGADFDQFGRSVAISPSLIVVGATGHGAPGNKTGAAYVFDAHTGQQLHKLGPSDGVDGDGFGAAVGVTDGKVIVGAPGHDVGLESNAGSMYVFNAASGKELGKVSGSGFGDEFGAALSAWDGLVAVGAPGALRTRVFDVDQPVGKTYCWSWPNSTGEVGTIVATGSTLAADNELALTAAHLPPQQAGYFINSDTQGFVAFPGGSQGNLCLGGTIGRHSDQVGSTGIGFLSLNLDLTQLPHGGGNHSVMAGETWNWQCWYRDFNQTHTSNFTYAVSVTFQ